jgi:hypothetical protein
LGSKQCDPVMNQTRATYKIPTVAHRSETQGQGKLERRLSPILAQRQRPSPTRGTRPDPLSLSPKKIDDG